MAGGGAIFAGFAWLAIGAFIGGVAILFAHVVAHRAARWLANDAIDDFADVHGDCPAVPDGFSHSATDTAFPQQDNGA